MKQSLRSAVFYVKREVDAPASLSQIIDIRRQWTGAPGAPEYHRVPTLPPSVRCFFGAERGAWLRLAAFVHRFDGLDRQLEQWIERTGALIGRLVGAVQTDVFMKTFDVGVHCPISRSVGDAHDFLQVKLYPTAFPKRRTGRTARRSLNTPAADLLANLSHVFVEF